MNTVMVIVIIGSRLELKNERRYNKNIYKEKIEYIELVQKDLEEFKNRELFLKEPLNSLTKTKETMLLSAAINLLQELISVYGSVLQNMKVEE